MRNPDRRGFIKQLGAAGALTAVPVQEPDELPAEGLLGSELEDRIYWVNLLTRTASPVLSALALGQLRSKLPVQPTRADFSSLEAFGRLLCGMAPWLELEDTRGAEATHQESFRHLVRVAMAQAVEPDSPDFMNFERGNQPLVDAAFLAQALIRAPHQLWERLNPETQARLVDALFKTRKITPYFNNWLLFSAMIETFLQSIGVHWDRMRVELSLRTVRRWYLGDGVYGDGPDFHWDYYNSFVIQPFLVDIVRTLLPLGGIFAEYYPRIMAIAGRHAEIQERLISPEGSYPPIGRSLAYRFGAFHLLSQMALLRELPGGLSPSQARCALTAVIRRQMEMPGTFDSGGWLTVGFAGNQPNIGEGYISAGSCYLCTAGLLPLGLPETDPFWASPPADWTARKLWAGEDLPPDRHLPLDR